MAEPDTESEDRGAGAASAQQAGPDPAQGGAARHCGSVAIVGRPNVGKSTLLNALVGQKISITSRKAQTTRNRVTGIRTVADDAGGTQLVFVDTPGFQTRHGSALNRAMNRAVVGAIGGVDLILFVVDAGSFTLADAKVLSVLKDKTPVLLIANKLDRVHRKAELAAWLQRMPERYPFTELVPMSAKRPADVERLVAICARYMPKQDWWYAEGELTDRSEKFLASEVVREKLFRLTGDEIPYASAVIIDRFLEEPARGGGRFVRIAATILVERDSHKAIIVGHGGERLKEIGTQARLELEKLLAAKVFLELWVKVRSGWADDEARLRSLGFE